MLRPFFTAAVGSLILGAAVFGIFFFRPTLAITVTPEDAKLKFAGKDGVGGGVFAVWPGVYELTVEKEGFVPLRRTETLSIGQRLYLAINLKAIPKPVALTEKTVLLVSVSSDGKSIIYLGNDGKTLFSRDDKEQRALTPDSFNRPAEFVLSPTQDVAIIKNPNGEYFVHDFKRYNLVEQEQFLFGRDIADIDWLYPQGERLIYSYGPASGERSIIIANRTNKDLDRVFNLKDAGLADPAIAVSPDGKFALLVSRPKDEFKSYNLFLLDLFTKRIRQLTTDGSKTDARYSLSGKYILYTRFIQDADGINNQMLGIIDQDGRNRKDFAVRANLDQIAFLDDTTLVVAQSVKAKSKLIRLDLINGKVVEYYHSLPDQFHISRLLLDKEKGVVYVTASENPKEQYGKLYMIKLETSDYK